MYAWNVLLRGHPLDSSMMFLISDVPLVVVEMTGRGKRVEFSEMNGSFVDVICLGSA